MNIIITTLDETMPVQQLAPDAIGDWELRREVRGTEGGKEEGGREGGGREGKVREEGRDYARPTAKKKKRDYDRPTARTQYIQHIL